MQILHTHVCKTNDEGNNFKAVGAVVWLKGLFAPFFNPCFGDFEIFLRVDFGSQESQWTIRPIKSITSSVKVNEAKMQNGQVKDV